MLLLYVEMIKAFKVKDSTVEQPKWLIFEKVHESWDKYSYVSAG